MLFVTNPTGNFPLNDDWMYSKQVLQLLQNHTYKIVNEYSPVLVSQVFSGALFCLPFGFSFIALRISGIVLGILGTIVFYLLLNRITNNKPLSFFCSLLIACNPFFFCLSNSFMSDVPFLSFSLISILLFFQQLEKPSLLLLLLASTASAVASLTRQFGVIIPMAYAIVMVVQNRKNIKNHLISFLPVIIIGLILFFTMLYLKRNGFGSYDKTELSTFLTDPLFFSQISARTGLTLYYSGFFCYPC